MRRIPAMIVIVIGLAALQSVALADPPDDADAPGIQQSAPTEEGTPLKSALQQQLSIYRGTPQHMETLGSGSGLQQPVPPASAEGPANGGGLSVLPDNAAASDMGQGPAGLSRPSNPAMQCISCNSQGVIELPSHPPDMTKSTMTEGEYYNSLPKSDTDLNTYGPGDGTPPVAGSNLVPPPAQQNTPSPDIAAGATGDDNLAAVGSGLEAEGQNQLEVRKAQADLDMARIEAADEAAQATSKENLLGAVLQGVAVGEQVGATQNLKAPAPAARAPAPAANRATAVAPAAPPKTYYIGPPTTASNEDAGKPLPPERCTGPGNCAE